MFVCVFSSYTIICRVYRFYGRSNKDIVKLPVYNTMILFTVIIPQVANLTIRDIPDSCSHARSMMRTHYTQ